MAEEETREYILNHKRNVLQNMILFSNILYNRGMEHDNSKLEEPEFSLWCKMDEEKKYPYGSEEYNDKLKRNKKVFKLHYKDRRNSHHPENFKNDLDVSVRKDLIDIIEMLCDWLSYKKKLRYSEASQLVFQQCQRYGFSEELSDLILNTLKNHFVFYDIDDDQSLKREKIDILV